MEILLTGDPIDARSGPTRSAWSTASSRTPTCVDRAQALAERIAANAPLSVRAAKRTAYLSAEFDRAEAYEQAERIWEPVYLSADAQEGPAAFRDKRAAGLDGALMAADL